MNDDARHEFYARTVTIMNCTPGNFDHAKGEPASIIMLGHLKSGEINPWVLSMRDSKLLASKLLVVLATYDDEFAQRLLEQHFPANDEGDFDWPNEPYLPFNL